PGTEDEQSTQTDPEGRYQFADVAPGEHVIEFGKPSGLAFTLQKAGNDPTRDSDPDPATGLTASFPVTSGAGTSGIDAGLYVPPSVRGNTWRDADGNGLRSASESPVELTVKLYTAAGVLVATRLATGGAYDFTGLVPGSYYARFTADAGDAFTLQ